MFKPDKIKIETDNDGNQLAYLVSEEAENMIRNGSLETNPLLQVYKLLHQEKAHTLFYDNKVEHLVDGIYDKGLFKELFVMADLIAHDQPIPVKTRNSSFMYVGKDNHL